MNQIDIVILNNKLINHLFYQPVIHIKGVYRIFLYIMRYFLLALLLSVTLCCVHDEFIKDAKMVFLNDLDGPYARILQQSSNYSNIGGYLFLYLV